MNTQKGRIVGAVGLALAFLALAGLACIPTSGPAVAVTITSPPSGSTVTVGDLVEIVSTATAEGGVAQVQLLVNSSLVRADAPPGGNPTTFSIVQSWTPTSAGSVNVSVVAFDAAGATSQAAVITLQVVEGAAGGVPVVEVAGAPTATPVEDVEAEGCTLNASYVADVTIPDNTEFAPGTTFVKTWRIRNSGTCDWVGFNLVFVGGDQMGGQASVAVPGTAAGSTADLSVNLTAPAAYGTYKGNWRMQSDTGLAFGSTVYVQIVVPAPPTDTPVPTDTPLPTVTPTPGPTLSFQPVLTAVIQPGLLFLLPYTEYVYQQATVSAGGTGNVVATCPGTSLVVGGGYASNYDVVFYAQYKYGNGWRGDATNNSGASRQITVYAVCLYNVSGASVTQVHAQKDVTPGNKGQALATCPAGSVATGGGYHAYPDGSLSVYNTSRADSGEGWQSWARNTSGSNKTHHAYAICLSGTSTSVSRILESVSIPASGTGYAIPKCGSGSYVTSGGFAAQEDLVMYSSSGPYSNDEWRVYAKNTSASNDRTMFGYADCLSFP